MKRRLALLIVVCLALTGCSSLKDEMIQAMNNNVDITLSVETTENQPTRKDLEWVELDQLTTFKDRKSTRLNSSHS